MLLLLSLLCFTDGLSISLEPYGIYGESPLAVAPDESFCLANQNSELFFFDRDGQLIKKAGGIGQGPDKFQSLAQIVWQGKHLFAYDQSYQQWIVFDKQGHYVQELKIPVQTHPRFQTLPLSLDEGLCFSNEERPSLIHWKGKEHHKRVTFPFWEDQPSTRIVADNPLNVYYLWDSDLLLASNGRIAVTMQNISKRATLIDLKTLEKTEFKVPFKRRPVTQSDKEKFLEGFPKNYKSKLKRFETPDYWPGVKRVLIDSQNRIWFFGQPQERGVAYIRFDDKGKDISKGTLQNLPAMTSNRNYSFKKVSVGWVLFVNN